MWRTGDGEAVGTAVSVGDGLTAATDADGEAEGEPDGEADGGATWVHAAMSDATDSRPTRRAAEWRGWAFN